MLLCEVWDYHSRCSGSPFMTMYHCTLERMPKKESRGPSFSEKRGASAWAWLNDLKGKISVSPRFDMNAVLSSSTDPSM